MNTAYKEVVKQRSTRVVAVDGDRCYKIFEHGYKTSDVIFEALNISFMEEAGLSVPHLIDVNVLEDGKWAIITEFIDGKTLEELMEEDPEKEDEYLDQFVDLQVEMHKLRSPRLYKHRDKMNLKISSVDLSATFRYALHDRIEHMPKHNNVLHGDYNPTNVIIDKEGKAYIVDWFHATQGDAEADAARTYMMFLIQEKKERARKYIDKFAEKSGCQIKDILGWLPILAASQSVKGIRNETEFLRNLIFIDEKGLEELYEKSSL